MVRLVDGKNLPFLFLGQTEQPLDVLELVYVFPLVKQYLAVRVVDDGLFHNRGADDVVHLLCHHHSLAKIFSDGLKKVLDVFAHIGGHQGFPAFLYQYHLTDTFEPAHLGDESFHNDQCHHRKKHFVAADIVQFEYDEPFACQVQFLVGVQQEVIVSAPVERFQNVQKTVNVKILLTHLFLFNHSSVVIGDKLIETVEVRSDVPVLRNLSDIGVHCSGKSDLLRTFRRLVFPFP